MATYSLEKMAAGGMYDQLGGGFHRYSVGTLTLPPPPHRPPLLNTGNSVGKPLPAAALLAETCLAVRQAAAAAPSASCELRGWSKWHWEDETFRSQVRQGDQGPCQPCCLAVGLHVWPHGQLCNGLPFTSEPRPPLRSGLLGMFMTHIEKLLCISPQCWPPRSCVVVRTVFTTATTCENTAQTHFTAISTVAFDSYVRNDGVSTYRIN